MNHLWRELKRLDLEDRFTWSVIDRWPLHDGFLRSLGERISQGLDQFDASVRDDVVIVFTAHSLPMKVVNRGDMYPTEVSATCHAAMKTLREEPGGSVKNKYVVAWQSQVGPLPWLGPKTEEVIEGLAQQNLRNALLVPVAFTSDHIETLFEIDIEYSEKAEEVGVNMKRSPSLNNSPTFIQAISDIAAEHLRSGKSTYSDLYGMNCPMCVNPLCRTIINPFEPYQKLRDKMPKTTA